MDSPDTAPSTPPSSLANSPPNGQWPDANTRKPNIIFILADQIAAPLLRIHDANSTIKTPHIDALAARSTVFSSAYCASPLCAPSRASLVTGQLPTKIGAWDNASPLGCDVPTYAHYLRREGYETVLAGKMHFIGEQLHGYEERLTSDIYPGDFGWSVNWDEPERRLEWYHNSSSILQAGPCIRSNQLDFDEEVMFKATRYLYSAARYSPSERPFCLTVSLTHPHDPYTIHNKYWDRYKDEEIPMPELTIPDEEQDPHSQRLLRVCGLKDNKPPAEAIIRARRAYYGAVSYVDDNVGRLLEVLEECGMAEDTINVSSMDILPTLVDLAGGTVDDRLPLDGSSLLPYLQSRKGEVIWSPTVFGEYAGEGTIAPLMMIRKGSWKFVICPMDPPQLYNLDKDPKELHNLAKNPDLDTNLMLHAFIKEAHDRWDFQQIHNDVLKSQRCRRLCWDALSRGRYESWDYQPREDDRAKYIRSNVPLDELELRARYPPVDSMGREVPRGRAKGLAGSHNQ
ncbi:MAG: hypothetical protein Q9222_007834 [Ikaeria aurantiellina]